ncbi:MAG: tRNA-dihydrouridine synthase [Clostridia bacterium]|nr:tRNA-dihydrouridine synthase [Clostridia bacterium]
MQLKKIKIGNIETPNNVFFAPLAGYSDAIMRSLCYTLGAGLCFTEMVSAKGLYYSPNASSDIIFTYPNEKIKAIQIFGNDPEFIKRAVDNPLIEKFDIIDINMGCPVPKIFSNGEGSALMQNFSLASKVIKSACQGSKPVTVKFRTGITDDKPLTRDFAVMAEDSGASLITIHGRSKTAVYSGECNYAEIEKAKNAVKIPVIANGGVFSVDDANRLIENTGADGVMLARGVLENPFLISNLTGFTPKFTLKQFILKQIELASERYGYERSAILLRKQMAFYLKGATGGKKLKEQVFSASNAGELINIIESSNCF